MAGGTLSGPAATPCGGGVGGGDRGARGPDRPAAAGRARGGRVRGRRGLAPRCDAGPDCQRAGAAVPGVAADPLRSTFAGIRDAVRAVRGEAPPVPLTSRASMTGFHLALRNDREQQLAAFGASGTLFGIVHKTSTAVAALDWTLWRKAASGNKEDRVEVSSHAILDMWNAPNEFYTNAE